jgi:hypothetical protein
MIPTKQIRTALAAALTASGLFESVIVHSEADLGAALTHIRDNPASLAVIVPGEDNFLHTLTDGINQPEFSEIRNQFELLITARALDGREDGVPDCVDLKDSTTELLLWSDLSVPGLICLPLKSEPLIVEIDENSGREAWKITLECRYLTLG